MLSEINNLSQDELNRFDLFIQSKFYNSFGTINKLFDYLKPLYPDIKDKDITKEKISVIIYNEKEINNKVYKLVSDFEKLLDKFLVTLVIENDKALNDMLLLRAYMKNNQKHKSKILNNQIIKTFERSYVTNENAYSSFATAEEEYFYYLLDQNDNRYVYISEKRTKTLDYYVVFKKLKNYFEEIICEVYMKADIKVEKNFYKDVLEFVEKNLDEIRRYHPYIYLYYLVARFYEKYDLRYVDIIIAYQEKHKKDFSKELEKEFNEAVINAYKKMQSKKIGDVDSVSLKLFETYDRMYMRDTDEKKNKKIRILSHEYIFIVNIAVSLKKMDWAHSFIKKYRSSIDDKFKEDCFNMCAAKINFAEGEFIRSIRCADAVSRIVHHYYYTARFIILKCHYEMKDFNKVDTVFDSLKKYSRRNKSISKYDSDVLKTFILIFTDLLKINKNKDNKKIASELKDELRTKISNLKTVLDSKNWFMKQLNS